MAACALMKATNSGRVCQKKAPTDDAGTALQVGRQMLRSIHSRQPDDGCAVARRSLEARCAILLECRTVDGTRFLNRTRRIFAARFPHREPGFGRQIRHKSISAVRARRKLDETKWRKILSIRDKAAQAGLPCRVNSQSYRHERSTGLKMPG
jgi:hypothetical protein